MNSFKQELWIPGKLPGMNEILAAAFDSKYNYQRMKKQWEQIIYYECLAQRIKPMDKVQMDFVWFELKRNRDKDNIRAFAKFAIDSLDHADIIKTDGWKHVQGFTDEFSIDKKNPGVLITLTEV